MIIAIDGPSGSGKSTIAKGLAQRLGFNYLDSGAMYRCVALASLEGNIPAAQVARTAEIRLAERTILDGIDVTEEIRSAKVSDAASVIAADPEVREELVAQQRQILAGGNWVVEGRDIGTVVAPDAPVKIFLIATAKERARRRAAEFGEVDIESVAESQQRRDQRDSTRAASPLTPAVDAHQIDTTDRTIDSIIEEIIVLVKRARGE